MNRRMVAGLVILGTLIATPAFGQSWTFGPKGGLSVADMMGDNTSGATSRIGFAAGGSLDIPFNESFHLLLEGFYVQKGAEFTTPLAKTKLNTAYAEIPVLVKMVFSDRGDGTAIPVLFAGPAVSVELNCDVESNAGTGTFSSSECDDQTTIMGARARKSFDVGIIVGGGVDVPVSGGTFHLEGRFNAGLQSIDNSLLEQDLRNIALSILGGFSFSLGG